MDFINTKDEQLFFGPNFVESKIFKLIRETKNDFTYPVYGWYWFDSEDLAKEFFGIPLNKADTI